LAEQEEQCERINNTIEIQLPEWSIYAINVVETYDWEDLGMRLEDKVMVGSVASILRKSTKEL
jgi:hypothetical protein